MTFIAMEIVTQCQQGLHGNNKAVRLNGIIYLPTNTVERPIIIISNASYYLLAFSVFGFETTV